MNPEPTALDAAAHVGKKIAEYGAYAVFFIAICLLWIGTPA